MRRRMPAICTTLARLLVLWKAMTAAPMLRWARWRQSYSRRWRLFGNPVGRRQLARLLQLVLMWRQVLLLLVVVAIVLLAVVHVLIMAMAPLLALMVLMAMT